ncbi:hypothetical protein ONR57_05185 [Hoyosella sp. YIM 151337]|uniref:hypothetical protein n=1 Tax=Hoyosella sp. YIM 151337 TaxID=2992742 RepID=UPI0022356183|nr:hypothetical protein [Hoyosella sp. YIM 151337]MCW4352689.1 hypothetical protein [Hoyosella sp. YIM 151337]
MQRKSEEIPPPPAPPNQLLLGWWSWRIAALLVLPAVVQILVNMSEVQARLAQQFATDPGLAGQGADMVAETSRLAPWGVIMAAVVLMIALLVCVAMMRRLGSRAARYAIIVIGLITVPITGLAYAMGQVFDGATFLDALPILQVVLMVAGTVLTFLRPSTDWLYLAHEYWEFERG